MGKPSDLELIYYRCVSSAVTTGRDHGGSSSSHRLRGGIARNRRRRYRHRRAVVLRASSYPNTVATAMAFMRKKRFKFQVELTLDELTEVALDKATLLAKVRQLDGGSFTDVSEK